MHFCGGKGLAGPGGRAPPHACTKQQLSGRAVSLRRHGSSRRGHPLKQVPSGPPAAPLAFPEELNASACPGTAVVARRTFKDSFPGCAKASLCWGAQAASCRSQAWIYTWYRREGESSKVVSSKLQQNASHPYTGSPGDPEQGFCEGTAPLILPQCPATGAPQGHARFTFSSPLGSIRAGNYKIHSTHSNRSYRESSPPASVSGNHFSLPPACP